MLSSAGNWNHNIHYHDVVLRTIPENCELALEVGCGQGLLARKLIRKCPDVVAIDVDRETIEKARALTAPESRIRFVEGDVMQQPFAPCSFELITAVATLHHLALLPALERFRDLLKPGGVLAVIGLYRLRGVSDYAWAALQVLADLAKTMSHGPAPVISFRPAQPLPHGRGSERWNC